MNPESQVPPAKVETSNKAPAVSSNRQKLLKPAVYSAVTIAAIYTMMGQKGGSESAAKGPDEKSAASSDNHITGSHENHSVPKPLNTKETPADDATAKASRAEVAADHVKHAKSLINGAKGLDPDVIVSYLEAAERHLEGVKISAEKERELLQEMALLWEEAARKYWGEAKKYTDVSTIKQHLADAEKAAKKAGLTLSQIGATPEEVSNLYLASAKDYTNLLNPNTSPGGEVAAGLINLRQEAEKNAKEATSRAKKE